MTPIRIVLLIFIVHMMGKAVIVTSQNIIFRGIENKNDIAKTPASCHGYSINVSSSIWEPFVTRTINKRTKKMWSGVEVNIMHIIANRLNLSLNFILNSERRTNRQLNGNGGLYLHLLRRHVLSSEFLCCCFFL